MPFTLISTTGALRFGPSRLLSAPALVDEAYLTASSAPDEIIAPPPPKGDKAGCLGPMAIAFLLFAVLQAAALGPPLLMARVVSG